MTATGQFLPKSIFISQSPIKHVVLSITVLLSLHAAANPYPGEQSQAVSIEYLTGSGDMHGMRLAYRPKNNHDLELPLLGDTRLMWEGSLNLFDLHGSAKNEGTYGLSLSPVFLKSLPVLDINYPLTFEFGIGVAYVHEQKFGGVDIGSYYQFEDRLGLLIGMDQEFNSEIALRYIHYSNGGLNTKNPGLDFFSLGYIYRF